MKTTKMEILAAKSIIATSSKPATKKKKHYRLRLELLKPYFKNFWIFVLIAIVVSGTQLILSEKALPGVYVNALAFVVLVGLALWKQQSRLLAISVAILPVANMINLVLNQTSSFAQTVVYYDSILILALVYRFMFVLDSPLEDSKLGRRGYFMLLGLMVVIGQALGVVGYLLLRHHYPFGHASLPLVAATSVVFAVTEETFFRGLIQQRGNQAFHPILAALLSLILYVSATIGHITYLTPLFALICGMVLVFTYYKKQNLILTITINVATKLVYIGLVAAFIFR